MKIALVSPYDFASVGGVNNHILTLQSAFREEGHDVKILAPSSKKIDSESFFRIGHILIPLPRSGTWAKVSFSPLTRKRSRQVFEENEFDVVHVHEPFTPLSNHHVMRTAKDMHLPVVATFHAAKDGGTRLYSWGKRYVNWKSLPSLIDSRICVSEASKQLVSAYFPGEYTIIPNMVDIGHFSPEKPPVYPLMDGKANILYVGRPEKRKGLDFLIDAYKILLSKGVTNTRLIIVGGDDKGKYRRLVHSRNLDDYVVFAGFVDYEELPKYYVTAAESGGVFCAPNIGNESFGIVLLEAMACGAPILASDLPAFRKVSQNGAASFVEPRNAAALAQGLEELVTNENMRVQRRCSGIAEAAQYNKNGIAKKILEVYNSVI